ncbi:YceI family protein [Carboxylicivirga marina]|uniref:YceI family protein n=1 Tax=Carboxylicivirga marina TaxID=2800988 RepID=A0ABS1HJF0_9BACT|nr:YceI family protein [Carboxylicivirga marina]MBK3517590.1 YceI family protein [Carboxylicivirga marina]
MKKITSAIAMLAFVVAVSAQSKVVDTSLSQITWLGKKVTGEHTGNISLKSGSLKMDGKKLKGGEFVVDMNSITCSDIDNKDYNAKLVGHLKSDDFFGVEKHALSTLKLVTVTPNGTDYKIGGELTIKGKTHPVSFDVTQNNGVFAGKLMVDRTKYDVRYGSGKFFDNLGDKMIYDEFELSFKVVLVK